MTDRTQAAAVIERQLKELEAIFKQASADLNTIRGKERVAAWKKDTMAVLAPLVDAVHLKRFAAAGTGPSFSNDLLEELGDEVEDYRTALLALTAQLRQSSP
jgi:hypothetical protein